VTDTTKHPLQLILEANERTVFAHQTWLAVSLVSDALGSLIADALDEARLAGDRDQDKTIQVADAFRRMYVLRNDPLVVFFRGIPYVGDG